MADWDKAAAKLEYITTGTSYRKLAEKYGVSTTQICNVGRDEKWVKQREQYLNKTTAKALEKISNQEANRAAKIYSVADKLLRKIESMADCLDPITGKEIRSLTASVKDLKDILGVKSDLEEKEQKARIAVLEKNAQGGNGKEPEKLEIIGLPEEFKQ